MDWTEDLTDDNLPNGIGCKTCGASGVLFSAEAGWGICTRCGGDGWDPKPWECVESEVDDWKW